VKLYVPTPEKELCAHCTVVEVVSVVKVSVVTVNWPSTIVVVKVASKVNVEVKPGCALWTDVTVPTSVRL
jgi:hypothetical protein